MKMKPSHCAKFMPLVHFFETSFGRIYSRRILLLTAL